ncbi:probable histidine kinase 3 [Lolium rigidum]|uniref:probable histidine kinase 3 n=1 Tax=Lolium rigidum TaxID=89674 RepID=UPI001F5CC608|nr:probable histidine kinase 3 [Lolium rigidum]
MQGMWWRLPLPLLWVVGWSFASLWIFFFMNSPVAEKRRELLVSMCDERARLLEDQFNISMRHMHALAVLVSTFHHSKSPSAMDQMTFAKYAERTELPLTSGLAYAVRVTHAEREQFERQQGWSIKRMCSSENCSRLEDTATMEISERAEEYAPIIFAQDAFKNVISVDMLSGIDGRENILRAAESGKGVLTAPFKLGVLNNRFGVILTYTLYKYDLPATARTEERSQAAVGYLGGIFFIEAHINKVLKQLVADKKSIMVNVYDTTHPRPIRMHCSNDIGSCSACISHNSTLNFGDPSRRHEMHCRFTQRSPWPWLAITSSFGTLVTALLVGYKIYAVVNHTPKVESSFQNMAGIKKRA